MTKREIASLACRMLALFFVLQAVISYLELYGVQLLMNVFQGVPLDFIFSGLPNLAQTALGSLVISFIVASVLWFRAEWIGKKIVGEKENSKTSATLLEIQTVLIKTIGVLFFSGALLNFVSLILMPFTLKETFAAQPLLPQMIQFGVPAVFELVVSLIFIIKAKYLASYLLKK